LVALVVVQVPTGFWEKQAPAIFVVALILLVLVLLPFIGKVVNFSRRWIPLGFMNFQPSELAKLAIAMYAANYMVRRMDTRERFFRAVTPMVVAVAFVGVLLMRQPDMGAFIVVATIAMGILFLGGVNARMFFLMAIVILATASLYLYFDDLRRERILAYLDPWNPKYAQGKGYQLTHSLIALGRGEVFGQGLGSSVEKLHYLPEAHTDFLLAVIGEELGFVGVATVLLPVLLDDPPHLPDRPPGHRAGPCLCRPVLRRHRRVDGLPGLHQHGRQPGRAADQGPDAAADELWRQRHPDESGGLGDGAARGH
jgi:cell division protein FtsW